MSKRIFLIFTIIMVLITGTVFYSIASRARNYREQKSKSMQTKLPEVSSLATATPVPMPDPAYTVEDSSEKTEEKPKTLTQGQKYYRPLLAENSKNLLLIGKDPTYSNYDTLVVVSIDEESKAVKLVDLPRDMYIDYSEYILEQLKESDSEFFQLKGSRKLNAAHVVGRKLKYSPEYQRFFGKSDINFLTDLIAEIFEIQIDDYMAIETDGFREMIDYFGGVVVDVPYPMHYDDPTQDLYIHLEPGLQVLNGTQAEGFVRFRQGYNEDGIMVSYSRADNTFLFLKSFFKQHVTLKNLTKAGKVYEIARENTRTSVQSLGETYQYVKIAKKILDDGYTMESVIVEVTKTKNINGALYEIIRMK